MLAGDFHTQVPAESFHIDFYLGFYSSISSSIFLLSLSLSQVELAKGYIVFFAGG